MPPESSTLTPKNELIWLMTTMRPPARTASIASFPTGPRIDFLDAGRSRYAANRAIMPINVTWGRTMAEPRPPMKTATRPQCIRARMRAEPYAMSPMHSIIHDSLPMLDGQKSNDGRKKTSNP